RFAEGNHGCNGIDPEITRFIPVRKAKIKRHGFEANGLLQNVFSDFGLLLIRCGGHAEDHLPEFAAWFDFKNDWFADENLTPFRNFDSGGKFKPATFSQIIIRREIDTPSDRGSRF